MLILYKMGYITIDGEQFYVENKISNSLIEGNKRYRNKPKNKEKHKQKMKEYHKKENDKIQKELDDYYEKTGHKIELPKRKKRTPSEIKYFEPDDYLCECGGKFKYLVNKERHKKSMKHIKYVENLLKFNNEPHTLYLNEFNTEGNEILTLNFN